jgi:hypothetical protein
MSEAMMNLCVCRAVAMDVSRSIIFMPASASCLASCVHKAEVLVCPLTQISVRQQLRPILGSGYCYEEATAYLRENASPLGCRNMRVRESLSMPETTCWFWCVQGSLWLFLAQVCTGLIQPSPEGGQRTWCVPP